MRRSSSIVLLLSRGAGVKSTLRAFSSLQKQPLLNKVLPHLATSTRYLPRRQRVLLSRSRSSLPTTIFQPRFSRWQPNQRAFSTESEASSGHSKGNGAWWFALILGVVAVTAAEFFRFQQYHNLHDALKEKKDEQGEKPASEEEQLAAATETQPVIVTPSLAPEIQALEEALAEKHRDVLAKYQEQYELLVKQITTLQQQNTQLQERSELLRKQNQYLSDVFTKDRKDLLEGSEQLNASIQELKDQMAELESIAKEKENEHERVQSQLRHMEEMRDKKEQELMDLNLSLEKKVEESELQLEACSRNLQLAEKELMQQPNPVVYAVLGVVVGSIGGAVFFRSFFN